LRGQTDVAVECICGNRRQTEDIDARTRGRRATPGMINRDLHGRIPSDEISTDGVPVGARGQEDPVRVPDDGIVFNQVVSSRARKADAKVCPLSRVSISAEPVRTEPVVASATRQSYASTRIAEISIPHRDVAGQLVGRPADHEDTRSAVCGQGDTRDGDARARGQRDAHVPKSLHQTRPLYDDPALRADEDPDFSADGSAVAAGL